MLNGMDAMETFSEIKCFIVDMDGTFYLGDDLLPGAVEFTEAVKRSGKDYFFFTNNSSHNERECLDKLEKTGLQRQLQRLTQQMKTYGTGNVPPDVFQTYMQLQQKLKKYRS